MSASESAIFFIYFHRGTYISTVCCLSQSKLILVYVVLAVGKGVL